MSTLKNHAAARLVMMAIAALGLSACDPFKEDRAIQTEQTRIACLDKFCEGDVEPKRNMATENAIKLNGQWYLGPKEYGNPNLGAMSFYWPSKAATGDPVAVGKATEARKNSVGAVDNFYAVAIEIFLTGRGRWSDPKEDKPWEGRGWEGRFEELQKQGLRIERQQLGPELELVRFFDAQGKQHRHEFFLATQQQKILGNGRPGVACDHYSNPAIRNESRCTGGFFWGPDVYADFRFSATLAQDWPAIHQEIIRVLNLAKKVQP